jgi:hypothetical protein
MLAFRPRNGYLLRAGLNERTLSATLGFHLQGHFPAWHVDCECNRIGGVAPSLARPKDIISWDDTEARTVFPDIIVHKRVPRGPDLLVSETKKAGRDRSFDLAILRAFRTTVSQQVEVFLEVRLGRKDRGCGRTLLVG